MDEFIIPDDQVTLENLKKRIEKLEEFYARLLVQTKTHDSDGPAMFIFGMLFALVLILGPIFYFSYGVKVYPNF